METGTILRRVLMAKLYFNYGAMQSSKSANLLMVAHNYESQGKEVLLLTPAIDDRRDVGVIHSRVGIESYAYAIFKEDNLLDIVNEDLKEGMEINCILVDESQFLTREHVIQLSEIADYFNIPVMCYGLKNDFQNGLFEGSEALLLYADKIQEIKTICAKERCGKKAIMNLRLNDGTPVYDGEQIQIGDEEYVPVCRKHYHEY